MKIAYDRQTDSLSVTLKEGVAVAESDEDKPGVILDYDEHGDLFASRFLTALSHSDRNALTLDAADRLGGGLSRAGKN